MLVSSTLHSYKIENTSAARASYAEDKATGAAIGGGVGFILGILSLPNVLDG